MKNYFLICLVLICSSIYGQQKKDTLNLFEYKFRWYLNNVRDSTKVKEDIEKAIEQTKPKPKPKINSYNRLCFLYNTKIPLRRSGILL